MPSPTQTLRRSVSMKKFLKKRWPWIVGICVLIAAVIVLLTQCNKRSELPIPGEPTLIVETPQKLSVSQTEEFTLDVTIFQLGDARYSAMSMSIAFDSSRLEFLGVEEGNIFILSDEKAPGKSFLIGAATCKTVTIPVQSTLCIWI